MRIRMSRSQVLVATVMRSKAISSMHGFMLLYGPAAVGLHAYNEIKLNGGDDDRT